MPAGFPETTSHTHATNQEDAGLKSTLNLFLAARPPHAFLLGLQKWDGEGLQPARTNQSGVNVTNVSQTDKQKNMNWFILVLQSLSLIHRLQPAKGAKKSQMEISKFWNAGWS